MNGYPYALDNPVVYLDPSGRCAEPVSFIICAVVGGAIIGGITAATYDIAVTQGKGVQDLSNLRQEIPKILDPRHYCDVDWVEVAAFGGAGSVVGSVVG